MSKCLFLGGRVCANEESDYDVFLSPLQDFKDAVKGAGLDTKVVYLDRGDAFRFDLKIQPEAGR
jgi:hypothetical protein